MGEAQKEVTFCLRSYKNKCKFYLLRFIRILSSAMQSPSFLTSAVQQEGKFLIQCFFFPFGRRFSTSLFLNVLPLLKCSSGLNKCKFVSSKSGEYGGCGRTAHPNDFIFSWAADVGNVSDYISDNIYKFNLHLFLRPFW